MKSKKDIIYNLICEVDRICKKNNIDYALLYKRDLENDINVSNGNDFLGIGMTGGDIERFQTIVDHSMDDRFVECFHNNKFASSFDIRFYDKKTTCIDIKEYDQHVVHGIYIEIIEIRQMSSNIEKKLLNILLLAWKGSCLRVAECRKRIVLLVLILKCLRGLLGKKVCRKWLYRYYKKVGTLDNWDEIKKLKRVFIGTKVFPSSNVINMGDKRKIDKSLIVAENKNEIINTEIGYKAIITEDFESYILNCIKLRKKYVNCIRNKKRFEKKKQTAWEIYLMTYDVERLKKAYSQNGLNNDITKEYLLTKKIWEKKNVPFIEITEMEEKNI